MKLAATVLMAMFMLIIGSIIYLLFSVSFVKGLSDDKKKQRLYLALCLSVPFFIATLNYQGFCFKKMRFLNEQDIYMAIENSKYKKQSNECYGAYVFSTKKVYGCFEKHPENGYQYDTGDKFLNFLGKALGLAYARIQVREENKEEYHHFLLMDNCGNFHNRDW